MIQQLMEKFAVDQEATSIPTYPFEATCIFAEINSVISLREKTLFILYYDTSTRVLCRVAMLNDEFELQTMKLSSMICA